MSILLLNMNGITIHSKCLFQWINAVVFHIMVLMGFIQSLACIFSKSAEDFYVALLISDTLSILLWWAIFLKKKRLHKFIIHLSNKKFNTSESLGISIIYITIAVVLFPPSLIFLINIPEIKLRFMPVPPNRVSCRSFWLPKNNKGIILWFYNGVVTYRCYSVFFSCFLIFSICCALILKKFSKTKKLIPFINPTTAWKELEFYVRAMAEMDKIFTFPLFLLMAKISVDVFNLLSRFVSFERLSGSKRTLSVSAPLLITWFLVVVILGDLVQNRCLNVLNASFERLRHANSVVKLSYYDYKKMKSSLNLTAWKMFKINRSLLLTAFTFVVTYGVIIAQFKISSNDTH